MSGVAGGVAGVAASIGFGNAAERHRDCSPAWAIEGGDFRSAEAHGLAPAVLERIDRYGGTPPELAVTAKAERTMGYAGRQRNWVALATAQSLTARTCCRQTVACG